MTFSIIPEYSDMQSTLALITEYGANLEYNDFWNPTVYSDEAEVEKRIRYYTGIDRDRSRYYAWRFSGTGFGCGRSGDSGQKQKTL